MIYGNPAIRIEDDQTDRAGLRTLILSKMWQPSRWPLPEEEMRAEAPAIPADFVGPWMLYIGRQQRPFGGALRTYWTFEGADEDPGSPAFRGRENSLDYQFDPGFSQVDILLHPNIQELLDTYGGTVIDGEVIWPATVPSGSASGASGMTLGEDGKPNPMFGVKDFRRTEGMYTHRYLALDLSQAEAGVGLIHQTSGLPGKPPHYTGRDWLKWPSPFRRRGTVLDITEMYELSGPGGWPRPVYGTGSQR